ncbi:YdcF family protein [Undibacterium oligocarboniphilum]|uniref:YdcF family protein n=1 Tax=Undibacterium oligocarboniphilum TaxID=666702 RepID=A0A850QDP0_9BURK|nr:YdcF family protein [Undibacterium oligocarboniphilum]MBC3869736.1 YdcF family protein [Undibacterium oligocarboniphilum]NVO77339.1 YdcF family protein [Undibacterium oligocarboniphilum]
MPLADSHQRALRKIQPFILLLSGFLLTGDAILVSISEPVSFGVLFPAALGIALGYCGWRWHTLQQWRRRSVTHARLWLWGWTLFMLWLLSLAVFSCVIPYREETLAVASQPAPVAIIILGAGPKDCTPSAVLTERLNKGLQAAHIFPAAAIVVSGGKLRHHNCTEAQIMSDYLRTKGVAPSRILTEDRSTSTYENFKFSLPVLSQHRISPESVMLIVSSDFHVLRASYIAHRAGFPNTRLAGAETPLLVRYNARLREYFAFISGFILREY